MKNIIKHLAGPLALAVFIMISLASCTESREKLILGKWKIEDFKSNQQIPEGMEQVYNQMMEQMKNNSSFEFKADKTVTSTMSGITSSGTWSMDKEGKVVTITDNNTKKPSDAKIMELTKEKMVLEITEAENVMTLTLAHGEQAH